MLLRSQSVCSGNCNSKTRKMSFKFNGERFNFRLFPFQYEQLLLANFAPFPCWLFGNNNSSNTLYWFRKSVECFFGDLLIFLSFFVFSWTETETKTTLCHKQWINISSIESGNDSKRQRQKIVCNGPNTGLWRTWLNKLYKRDYGRACICALLYAVKLFDNA